MSRSQPKHATTGFVIDLSTIVSTSRSGDKTLLPGSREAIAALQEKDVPFVIVARDTGMTEKEVAKDLEKKFNIVVRPSAIVLPQTPFRDHVAEYKDKTVVVIGGDGEKALKIASKYGFERVLTTRDIVALYPHLYGGTPAIYPHLYGEYASGVRRATKLKGTFDAKAVEERLGLKPGESDNIQVHAIFVWWASANWDIDIRICIDLLMTEHGRIGTHAITNVSYLALQPDKQPRLFVCKADTDMVDTAAPNAAASPSTGPGYGRGHAAALAPAPAPPRREGRTWLETLRDRWMAATGLPLEDVDYTYFDGAGCDRVMVDYADAVLRARTTKLLQERLQQQQQQQKQQQHAASRPPFPRTVYMVGREIPFGAHSDRLPVRYDASARRRSIRLVPPGVGGSRQPPPTAVHDFHPLCRPWHVAGGLKEAVEYALAEEYWDCIEHGLSPLFPKPKDALNLWG
ncbi:44cb1f66-9f49-4a90-ae34-93c9ac8d97ca [Thermothielavioides terrestris]|uniref:44cb1f66-9f49-4a90-ae34-93c9ac8d97ca n=1 Tax=Thermothielavioides terrestris TaxID=2587410 RepID=A0A446BQT3_9PEZI|nr:44cb1f66-9f49-4a90-ae34-93c9ac8d97ca [Thermothielavioides terrestris]